MVDASQRPLWALVLWASVGVLVGLGVVGILSIGVYALALAVVLAVLGLVLPASRSVAALAILPGLGVLPLVVGLSNLGGPGTYCSETVDTMTCAELLSPWPFLVPGLVLVVGGTWLVWRLVRRHSDRASAPDFR
ncbi:MAG: hypothetical protein QM779_05510 [Propionicimonas sp.]|uniref:hypothetical protein n=1 Tax=Propionicimonas sp. TaxID=1955623 RepID=UPI003D10481C